MRKIRRLSFLLVSLGFFWLSQNVHATEIVQIDGASDPTALGFSQTGNCNNVETVDGILHIQTAYNSCAYQLDLTPYNLSVKDDIDFTFRSKYGNDSKFNLHNIILTDSDGKQVILRGYSPTTYRIEIFGEFGKGLAGIEQSEYHLYHLSQRNQSFTFSVDGSELAFFDNTKVDSNAIWSSLTIGNIRAENAYPADTYLDYLVMDTVTLPLPIPSPDPSPIVTPTSKLGDTDNDFDVDIFDYNTVVSNFGKAYADADFNNNGSVDIFDYNTVISEFGK